MRSLRGLIVSEDSELRGRVSDLLDETGLIEPALVLSQYPTRMEGGSHIRLTRPDVAFLVIDRIPAALDFIREMDATIPGAAIVAISRLEDPRALAELMRVGVRDFVAAPINRGKFHDAVRRIVDQHNATAYEPTPEPLVTFVPSRGGSGTSTLACNIAQAVARNAESPVLMADLDLFAGLSRYLFQITPTCSLAELAEFGQLPDEHNWTRCVMEIDNLHILFGGRQDVRQPITPAYIRELLQYAAERYSALVVDLPVTMDGFALELLRRSRRILLVTTSEVPSIGLAREKLEYLSGMDLHTRTSVLLTLCPGGAAPSLSDLQAYLGAPIDGVFDFTEKKVRQSLGEGLLIDRRTALGHQIEQFAQDLSALLHP